MFVFYTPVMNFLIHFTKTTYGQKKKRKYFEAHPRHLLTVLQKKNQYFYNGK